MKKLLDFKKYKKWRTEDYNPPKYLIIPAPDDIMFKKINKVVKDKTNEPQEELGDEI